MSESTDARVLVVDDEQEVADVFALRLQDRYDVDVAYGGEEAIEKVAGADVVLLDRRMPDLTGDDVLAEIRERDLSCRVIMVTAVEPDFDIVEMPFDDYLCKPVDREDLVAAIDRQLEARTYDEKLSTYFEVSTKLAALEAGKTEAELADSEEYQRLKERADALDEDIGDPGGDAEDLEMAFADVSRYD